MSNPGAELAVMYRTKARAIFLSINNADIDKANLLQKAPAGAIMLDKSLLLAGEGPTLNVSILLDVVEAIKARQQQLPIQVQHTLEPEFEP